MGHYAYECKNPSKKPFSERPDAYQRAKSPSPNRRDPRTPSQNAHLAVERPSCDDNAYEWSIEDAELGCVAVHTAPVTVVFNITHLTDTVTNLPISLHTPAPSLLDDGDIESQPGPLYSHISPNLQHKAYMERAREFAES
jgi:hypothetical protein